MALDTSGALESVPISFEIFAGAETCGIDFCKVGLIKSAIFRGADFLVAGLRLFSKFIDLFSPKVSDPFFPLGLIIPPINLPSLEEILEKADSFFSAGFAPSPVLRKSGLLASRESSFLEKRSLSLFKGPVNKGCAVFFKGLAGSLIF